MSTENILRRFALIRSIQKTRINVSGLFFIIFFKKDFQAAVIKSIKKLEKIVDDGSKQKLKREKQEPSPISYERPSKSPKLVIIISKLEN